MSDGFPSFERTQTMRAILDGQVIAVNDDVAVRADANASMATRAAAAERFDKLDLVTVDPNVRTRRSAVTRTGQDAGSEGPVVVSLDVSHDTFVDLAATMLAAKRQLDRSSDECAAAGPGEQVLSGGVASQE